MSNRVEELESQVVELQAAVDGLTEELVETRERLRRLESEHGVEMKRAPDRRDSAAETEADVDGDTSEEREKTDNEASESTTESEEDQEGSDIIVA